MITLKDSLTKLREFKHAHGKRFSITRLGIFGSVARRENTAESDLDIVVEMESPTLSLMYELEQSLHQIFGCKVDVVRMRESLRPVFKENIKKDAVFV